jgi:chorismate mutase/prephenate dehydratase
VRLLNQRANVSLEVGRQKGRAGEAPTFAPGREASLISGIEQHNPGPLKAEHLRAIYREILSSSRDLQAPMRIAYLGPAATFTHVAALARFGHAPEYLSADSIPDVFAEVRRGGAHYGVVPVENSSEGADHETLDQLVETELQVCSEVTIRVVHNLLAAGSLDAIRTLYTHPSALAQCRGWIGRHLPEREVVSVVSAAKAAEQAATDPHGAAIGTALAAEVYGLPVLESGIQDQADNWTRFLVLGNDPSERPTGWDRTFVVFSIKDRVGVLRDVMNSFSDHDVNLASIQSRPSRKRAWDYVFFVELDGHAAEERVRAALAQAEPNTVFMKVVGSWPRA